MIKGVNQKFSFDHIKFSFLSNKINNWKPIKVQNKPCITEEKFSIYFYNEGLGSFVWRSQSNHTECCVDHFGEVLSIKGENKLEIDRCRFIRNRITISKDVNDFLNSINSLKVIFNIAILLKIMDLTPILISLFKMIRLIWRKKFQILFSMEIRLSFFSNWYSTFWFLQQN